MDRRTFLQIVTGLALLPGEYTLAAASSNFPVRKTGFLYDPIFLKHSMGAYHPESRQRLVAVNRFMQASDIYQRLQLVKAEATIEPYIYKVHTRQHVDSIRQYNARAGEVATRVVSAAITATDHVCRGDLDNAFCASRPPGHHALNTGKEEGFCYFNAIAVAAHYARAVHGVGKIAIIDWDYHHGNGTELVFYDDPSVLFFSTHNMFAYPGTGHPDRKGAGKGKGFNINVHLGCDTTDADILTAFEQNLLPAITAFKPELILISAGFDSRTGDRLGCFEVTDSGFIALTNLVIELADTYCDGKIVSILEGGYSPDGLARAVEAHVGALLHKG